MKFKKSIFLFFFCIIFNQTVSAEEPLLAGLKKSYYDNGKLKSELTYKEGVLDGSSKIYFPNGQLAEEGFFKNGKVEGLVKKYSDTGVLIGETNYQNGQWSGVSREHYEDGTLMSESNFTQGMGVEKRFYKSGALKEEVNFKNYQLDGTLNRYYEQGPLRYQYIFRNGEVIERKYYAIDGTETSWKELDFKTRKLAAQGKNREAIKIAKKAVKEAQKVFGKEDLHTASSQYALASLYYADKKNTVMRKLFTKRRLRYGRNIWDRIILILQQLSII